MRCVSVKKPTRRSIDQLRGAEGACVREMYKALAARHGVAWQGRQYDPGDWNAADTMNRCLSAATAALYGITEAGHLSHGARARFGGAESAADKLFVIRSE